MSTRVKKSIPADSATKKEKVTKKTKSPAIASASVPKVLKKRPQSDGVTKQRRLKKKQSDSILKAVVDGCTLEDMKRLIATLKAEEKEALVKKEAKNLQKEQNL